MNHGKSGRKLGVSQSHRRSIMRSLATALFTHGRIRTTLTRAKELSRLADRMITWAKRGDLHARRLALAWVHEPAVVGRLFKDIAPWYQTRRGGYTKLYKLANRPGDNAPMAFVELVDRKELGPLSGPPPQKKPFKNKGKKKAPEAKS